MSDVLRVVDGDVVNHKREALLPLPGPDELRGGGISIREATLEDMGFIDALQKKNTRAVGFMFTKTLEGHIAKGHVLIAEAVEEEIDPWDQRQAGSPPHRGEKIGYCIGVDKYFKREDVGIIYQMNITPGNKRRLVAASLLKAMFDRSAYGVRLFCCWCAQDLEANGFWEAMGFVPLAFRAGSQKTPWVDREGVRHKGGRIHIFWQKAIRDADAAQVREGNFKGWWFPSQTGGGAMREDRIVLPIPPGTNWSDAKPTVLPGVSAVLGEIAMERDDAAKRLEGAEGLGAKGLSTEERAARKLERKEAREAAKKLRAVEAERAATVASGGLHFGGASNNALGSMDSDEDKRLKAEAKQAAKDAAKLAQKRVSKKNDPRLVAMARELRDRWLEEVAAPGSRERGTAIESQGKYEVCRLLGGPAPGTVPGCSFEKSEEQVEQMRVIEVDGVEVLDAAPVKRLDAA